MVEQSLSGPGKLGWYEKENKNVRNLKVHTEKLLHGSMPKLLHNSHPNNGNLVLTQLNNDNWQRVNGRTASAVLDDST
ncbi:MAG: hypothetical protein WB975_07870 [Nitrososphaeraceae archaeon]